MKTSIWILLALMPGISFSQVYISSNYYMYAKDQVLFVKQDINLQNNAAIYLRNESQLVQGTTGTSTNSGQGKLSVFQEGSVDNYEYNYWCSPVGNASASSGNENFGITMLNSPTSASASTAATILADNNYDGTASPLGIAPYWIWKFLSSANYSEWIPVGALSNIASGEGFTMKGTAGTDTTIVEGNGVQNNPGGTGAQRYDFRGKPNDGTITVNLAATKYTLTGNPYPSTLHMNAFLLDASNSACTGIAYYYEQDKTVNSHYVAQYKGGYGTYSPISLGSNGVYVPATFDSYNGDGSLNTTGTSSGLSIERKYAPVGQGFMVEGATTGTVSLKNSHRVYYKESGAYSEFQRPAHRTANHDSIQPISLIRINTILNNANTRQLALAFLPDATNEVDRGIDALAAADEDLPTDVYTLIGTDRYVIQGMPFDINTRIKLGLKIGEAANLKFYIPEVIAFDNAQAVYIYDALDATYHDIKNATFELDIPAGIYNDRFEITFTNAPLSVLEPVANAFTIIQKNSIQLLTIGNADLNEITAITLFDISGKSVFEQLHPALSETYSFSTAAFSDGVYIVRILTKNGDKSSQKIVIARKQ